MEKSIIKKYRDLKKDYGNKESLMYKKLRIVDSYIDGGEFFLDLGVGTGELLELVKNKFSQSYGIDIEDESIEICKKRFKNSNISIIQHSINNLNIFEEKKFNYITCCDVLEHVPLDESKDAINNIFKLLNNDGIFIFTGPGFFEKLKIRLGKSPEHIHSHSSYGWKKLIEEAGFKIISIETVEFPLINNEFLRKKLHIFGKCCLIIAKKI